MPHIHIQPQGHDLTVTAYIVLLSDEGNRVLFHIHKKVKKFMAPGGHVELTENPWEAITHELLEETGYDINQLKVLQPPVPKLVFEDTKTVKHPIPFMVNTHPMETNVVNHYHTDLSYLFTTTELPQHNVGEGESTVFQWFSEADLVAATDDEILSSMKQTGLMALAMVKAKIWDADNSFE